jgi:hypothetical protein
MNQEQPLGLRITGGNSPGVSLGGLVQIKSARQLLKEEAEAHEANSAPVVQGLAGHIRQCWSEARTAKEMTVEPRMLQSIRQRRGEYDPTKLAQLIEQGSSTIYMMLTSNKCRAASSWLRDVLVTSVNDKPWTIKPTAIPDISPDILQQVMSQAQTQIQQMMASGVPMSDQDVRQLLLNLKDQAMAQVRQIANESAERMEAKMEDQLSEGGWQQSFSEFIDDITTFPSAFMKGPVVRRRQKLKWVPGPNGSYELNVQDDLSLEWERVDPFHIYPAPDASKVNDGYLIERHRLHRADLNALIGVEGYSDGAIRNVLSDYGTGGLHDWVSVDNEKAIAEGKSPMAASLNPSGLIDALQFWGSVQGQLLLDWGMDPKKIKDPLAEYNIEAWLIGSYVIKAVVNPDPLGRKPYYKASYEEVPGAFWGNSVADLARDTQDMCNATARALVNNMGIASGPQVVYDVSRLPDGENITQMYPWKVWQVTSDPMGGSAKPMDFFQPETNAQELMAVYDRFATLADEYTGIPRYMTGDSPSGGAGRTASGMSMLMSNAGKSIKQVIANIDMNVTQQAIERLYFYNMKFSNDPDLKGDVNIVARGAASLMQQEQSQQRRNEFLQIALANPVVNQVVGMEGIAVLLREAAKHLDMDADQIVPPLEILKQRWAQQAAAQAQMAQEQAQQQQPGVSAPGGTPAGPPAPGQQLMDGSAVTNNFQPQGQ